MEDTGASESPSHPKTAAYHRDPGNDTARTGTMSDLLQSIGESFQIPGRFVSGQVLGSGHIHDTYRAVFEEGGTEARYVVQRLNARVFADPERLMQNLVRVTDHVRKKLADRGVADVDRHCLRVIPSIDGRPFSIDTAGHYWRCFPFQEGTRSHETIVSRSQADETARAFGSFLELVSDLPPPPLAVTIPEFHDLDRRLEALEAAIAADAHRRLGGVQPETESARREHRRVAAMLGDGGANQLPRRTVHNDCKLNNLLFDAVTGRVRCVIDLDTVMEGTVLFDFGELVRTVVCAASEDSPDLTGMTFDRDVFAGLAHGYRAGAGALLTEAELHALPLAGPALALENAIRFLTDHLEGDVYFRIHREGQNRDRCRAQLRRVDLLMENLDVARREVEGAAGFSP